MYMYLNVHVLCYYIIWLSSIIINDVLLVLAPIDKMKEVLIRTVSEAKAAISKVWMYSNVSDACIID